MREETDASVRDWRSALGHLGLEPLAARRIRRGRNTHWVVKTRAERLVLRLYHTACAEAEVAYELAVLGHLKARGWPVAVPVSEVIASPVGRWRLFTHVPGRQRVPRTPQGRYAEEVQRGRLLARLHADLSGLTYLGQRDGWRTTLEGVFGHSGNPSVLSVLTRFAEQEGEQGDLLLAYHERARRALETLPLSLAPQSRGRSQACSTLTVRA